MGHSVSKPPDQTSRILGVAWNSSMDTFYFDFTEFSDNGITEITERSILWLTARIFNPLEFVSPFIIQLKILLQDLCVGKLHHCPVNCCLSGE